MYDSPNASQTFPFCTSMVEIHRKNDRICTCHVSVLEKATIPKITCTRSKQYICSRCTSTMIYLYKETYVALLWPIPGDLQKKLSRSDYVPFESIRFLCELLSHTVNSILASNLRVFFVLRLLCIYFTDFFSMQSSGSQLCHDLPTSIHQHSLSLCICHCETR